MKKGEKKPANKVVKIEKKIEKALSIQHVTSSKALLVFGSSFLLVLTVVGLAFMAYRFFRENPLKLFEEYGAQMVVRISNENVDTDLFVKYIEKTHFLDQDPEVRTSILPMIQKVAHITQMQRLPVYAVLYNDGYILVFAPKEKVTFEKEMISLGMQVKDCFEYMCYFSNDAVVVHLELDGQSEQLSNAVDDSKFGSGLIGFQTVGSISLPFPQTSTGRLMLPYQRLAEESIARTFKDFFGSISFQDGKLRMRLNNILPKELIALINGNGYLTKEMSNSLLGANNFSGFISIPDVSSDNVWKFLVGLFGEKNADIISSLFTSETSYYVSSVTVQDVWNILRNGTIGVKITKEGQYTVALDIGQNKTEELLQSLNVLLRSTTQKEERVRLPDRTYGTLLALHPERLRTVDGTGSVLKEFLLDEKPILYYGKDNSLSLFSTSSGFLMSQSGSGDILSEFTEGKEYAFSFDVPGTPALHLSFGFNVFDDRLMWEIVLN